MTCWITSNLETLRFFGMWGTNSFNFDRYICISTCSLVDGLRIVRIASDTVVVDDDEVAFTIFAFVLFEFFLFGFDWISLWTRSTDVNCRGERHGFYFIPITDFTLFLLIERNLWCFFGLQSTHGRRWRLDWTTPELWMTISCAPIDPSYRKAKLRPLWRHEPSARSAANSFQARSLFLLLAFFHDHLEIVVLLLLRNLTVAFFSQ